MFLTVNMTLGYNKTILNSGTHFLTTMANWAISENIKKSVNCLFIFGCFNVSSSQFNCSEKKKKNIKIIKKNVKIFKFPSLFWWCDTRVTSVNCADWSNSATARNGKSSQVCRAFLIHTKPQFLEGFVTPRTLKLKIDKVTKF